MKLLVFILFSFSLYADYSGCDLNFSNLPECPSSNTRLAPKHYPAQVIFPPENLNSSNLNAYIEAVGDNQKIAVPHRIYETLKSNPRYKDKIINLDGRGEEFRSENSIPGIPPGGANIYNRDGAVITFDQSSQSFVINSRMKDRYKDYKVCGVDVKYQDAGDQMESRNANLGGNIIGLPGGGCMVGENMDSDLAIKLCGQGNPIVKLDTTGTTVGHVDELYNIIPNKNKEAPCNFSVIITNPDLYTEHLRSNPNDLFFENGLMDGHFYPDGAPVFRNENGSGNVGRNPHDYLCKLREKFNYYNKIKLHLNNSATEDSSNHQERQGQSAFIKLINIIPIKKAMAFQRLFDEDEDPCSPDESYNARGEYLYGRKPENFAEKCLVDEAIEKFGLMKIEKEKINCRQLKNKDILEILDLNPSDIDSLIDSIPKEVEGLGIFHHHRLISEIAELKELTEGNKKIKETIAKNKDIIKANLPTQCRNDSSFIELPAFYNGRRSITPNPTNLQVVGDTAFSPQQFDSKITQMINNSLASAGLKNHEIDTFNYHVGGGNIHCLTNEMRACKPAQ